MMQHLLCIAHICGQGERGTYNFGIAWIEMLEHDQRFGGAGIDNRHAVGGGVGREEELVLGHRADADQRRRRDGMRPQATVALL